MKKISPDVWGNLALFLIVAISVVVPKSNSASIVVLLLASMVYFRAWWPPQPLSKDVLAVFMAMALLALVWIVDSLVSGRGAASFEKPLKLLLPFVCMHYLLAYPPRAVWLWRGSVAGAVALAALALYQVLVLHYDRAGNAYINSIRFGNAALVLALLCAIGWYNTCLESNFRRIGLSLGVVCGLAGVFLSGTRGSWFVLVLVLQVWIGVLLLQGHKKILLSVAACIAVVAAVLIMNPRLGVQQRIEEAQTEVQVYSSQGVANTSIGARLQMWQFALHLYIQKPIFGWSQQGYDAEKKRLIDAQQLDPFLHYFNHPHNDLLDAASKRGTVGAVSVLACHLSWFVFFVRRYRRQRKSDMRALCMAGMMLPFVFFGFGLTDSPITSNGTIALYFYLATILMAMVLTGSQEVVSAAKRMHTSDTSSIV